jgi:asparagine N-glycosylation enzyme membrane subunit Stt3
MKKLYKILSYLLILLGVIHIAFTPVFVSTFSPAAVWFVAGGLALVFLGLLNLIAIQAAKRLTFSTCLIANLIGIVYGILIVIAVTEPHAFAALVLIILVTLGSVNGRKVSYVGK